jgi:hypothetical protein
VTTPAKSELDAARERLEAELQRFKECYKFDPEHADVRLMLDALKEAERVADAGKRYFQSHYTRWADGGGPNECEHGIAAGIDCLLCDEKTLNGWREQQ